MKRVLFALALFIGVGRGVAAAPLAGFVASERFHEQVMERTLADGVLSYTSAPGDFDGGRPTWLIVYLLPNGNTIPQTLGRGIGPGDDWHYDIQHIGAQVRLLRELEPGRNVVVTLLQAPGRSWPKFRADHPGDNPKRIRALVGEAVKPFAGEGRELTVTLAAHSGGGSFVFGYLNSEEPVPAYVDRIAFLEANYAYDDADRHGEKLGGWLKSSPEKRLVVFCYDDRNVVMNGKHIVSEAGGTYGRTKAMTEFFSKGEEGTRDRVGPFERVSFVGGRAQFFIHPNPEVKILHTALIGEMNAFLHAMTLGTEANGRYGVLGGPRAYSRYVDPAPATRPTTRPVLKVPAREGAAVGGAGFLERVKELSVGDREALVEREVLGGNVPASSRTLVPITVTAAGTDGQHTATYYVTPDVLAVGVDGDSFRMPLTPGVAGRIAGALDCSLITRKVSDDIYANAVVKLEPRPLTEKREAAETLYQHHEIIEGQLKEVGGYVPGVLVAGHKKDVVITPRLGEKPHKVAIYGWHRLDGKAIQPLYVGHADYYVDYSHGIRLMSNHLLVDGRPMTVGEVLASPVLCSLLSDEGPVVGVGYTATRPTTEP